MEIGKFASCSKNKIDNFLTMHFRVNPYEKKGTSYSARKLYLQPKTILNGANKTTEEF